VAKPAEEPEQEPEQEPEKEPEREEYKEQVPPSVHATAFAWSGGEMSWDGGTRHSWLIIGLLVNYTTLW
jgi:hypothetical protein